MLAADQRRRFVTELTLAIDRGEIEFDHFYDRIDFWDRQSAAARAKGLAIFKRELGQVSQDLRADG